ncbi:helix-turn-helix transcriptional regulator [Leucobacter sp. G161]|uniref:helix-turn-helix domain-containing protein n=1 Tax=Leucobacter sp. G161 TaxID=663704 RepID=UPI00073BEABA|nr:helix-turn-helix transcriptional regulator [Leucobacter sp. G161]KUF07245.1 hypothetical protein AUL38_10250 [Leucobacter sp. G161]
MATISLRPNALKRVQALSGIDDDHLFARAVGVSPSTLHRAKAGQGDSVRLIAGIARTFGYSIGEIAVAVDEPNSAVADAA